MNKKPDKRRFYPVILSGIYRLPMRITKRNFSVMSLQRWAKGLEYANSAMEKLLGSQRKYFSDLRDGHVQRSVPAQPLCIACRFVPTVEVGQ